MSLSDRASFKIQQEEEKAWVSSERHTVLPLLCSPSSLQADGILSARAVVALLATFALTGRYADGPYCRFPARHLRYELPLLCSLSWDRILSVHRPRLPLLPVLPQRSANLVLATKLPWVWQYFCVKILVCEDTCLPACTASLFLCFLALQLPRYDYYQTNCTSGDDLQMWRPCTGLTHLQRYGDLTRHVTLKID